MSDALNSIPNPSPSKRIIAARPHRVFARCRNIFVGLCYVFTSIRLTHAQAALQSNPVAPMFIARAISAQPSLTQRKKADDFYVAGARAFLVGNFALAQSKFRNALALEPGNHVYATAADMATEYLHRRTIRATSLDHADHYGAHETLQDAIRQVISRSPMKTEENTSVETSVPSRIKSQSLRGPVALRPVDRIINTHLQGTKSDVIRQTLKAFGIRAMFADAMSDVTVRIDLEASGFGDVKRALQMLTQTFLVPIDPETVLVFDDTRQNREQFEPLSYETFALPSLSPEQIINIQNMAGNLLDIKEIALKSDGRSIELRGTEEQLQAFSEAVSGLFDYSNEILLDVQLYEVDRTITRNVGVQLPQQAGVFNINAEAAKLISDNQSVVDQAIASGLVSSGDTLGIVELLVAEGYASSSPLAEGFAVFGGGLTWSALSFGTTTLNLALNSSESHLVDKVQLRIKDRGTGTLRDGNRYPITTSQYSSVTSSATVGGINIANLTASQLAVLGLSSSSTSSSSIIPQVQYEDLGLTLAATPTVQEGGYIGLHLDLKICTLSGSSLNDIPILNNRQFTGDVTVRQGETAMMTSSMTDQESKAIDGIPDLSELPGFQTATSGGDHEKDADELLVLVTPHTIRRRRASLAGPIILLPFHVGEVER